jgi:hypothetical protein
MWILHGNAVAAGVKPTFAGLSHSALQSQRAFPNLQNPAYRPLVAIIERDYAQAPRPNCQAMIPDRPLVIDQVGLRKATLLTWARR